MTKLRRILKSSSHRHKAGDYEKCSHKKPTQRNQKPNKCWRRVGAIICNQGAHTTIITLATAAIALYAIKQFYVTRTQRDIMARQDTLMSRQTDLMDKQLAAMGEQAGIMREESHVGNRAYIAIDTIAYPEIEAGRVVPLFAVGVNSGNTPARNLSMLVTFDMDTSEENFFKSSGRRRTTNVRDIGSHAKFLITHKGRKFSDTELVRLLSTDTPWHLYAYIYITYEDIFGELHYTESFSWLRIEQIGQTQKFVRTRFSCKNHNGGD